MLLDRTNRGPALDFVVPLDRGGAVALHRQIEAAIRTAIHDGRLRTGACLPATRALAADLGVSRGVVVEAYAQLAAEGYLTSRSGSYTTVAAEPVPPTAPPPARARRAGWSTSAPAGRTARCSRARPGCARCGAC